MSVHPKGTSTSPLHHHGASSCLCAIRVPPPLLCASVAHECHLNAASARRHPFCVPIGRTTAISVCHQGVGISAAREYTSVMPVHHRASSISHVEEQRAPVSVERAIMVPRSLLCASIVHKRHISVPSAFMQLLCVLARCTGFTAVRHLFCAPAGCTSVIPMRLERVGSWTLRHQDAISYARQ